MKKILLFLLVFSLFPIALNNVDAATLNSQIIPISIWETVVFEGKDWLGFHVVKITITGENGFTNTLKIKTTHDGEFQVPWIIPPNTSSGNYSVFATDRVNNATTNFQI